MRASRVTRVLPLAALLSLAASGMAAGFEPPRPVVRTLGNGLRVAVFSDSSLDIVQMQVLVRVGSRDDPPAKAGLANLLALALKTGTPRHPRADLEAELDRRGISLTTVATRDFTVAGCSALGRQFEVALGLLADLVVHPAFEVQEVEQQRTQLYRSLVDTRLNPGAVAEENLWSMALAPHPYAQSPGGAPETVGTLNRDDLVAQHDAWFHPANAILAIAGQVDAETAFKAAEAAFADWENDSIPSRAYLAPKGADTVRVRVIDSPNLARAQLRVGAVTARRADTDGYALTVLNQLVGSAGRAIRATVPDSRSTLLQYQDAGLFMLSGSCGPDQAGAAVQAMRAALRTLRDQPPAAADLERAKRFLTQMFPMQFETRNQWMGQWLGAEVYGLPADYLSTYRQRIMAVTAADVQKAARRWLRPDRLDVVAVGAGDALEHALEGLGPLEVRDLRASAAAGTYLDTDLSKATPENAARARKVLDRAIAAHGGEAALRDARTAHTVGRMVLVAPGGGTPARWEVWRLPGYRMRTQIDFTTFGTYRNILTVNGSRAYIRTNDTLRVADSSAVREMRFGYLSDPPNLLLAAASKEAKIASLGQESFFGQPADVLTVVDPDRDRRRLYFDAKTGMLIGTANDERVPNGRVNTVQRRFREYRAEEGIPWSHYEERYTEGVLITTWTASDVQLRAAIPDSLFLVP